MNGTDLKFLCEVNSETRALVKRSSRKRELKKKFNIDEMSSISTLEFVWENKSSWPSHWWKTWFCYRVAETNKLELLKWAREEKKGRQCALLFFSSANAGEQAHCARLFLRSLFALFYIS